MWVVSRLDVMMARRKMSLKSLSAQTGISVTNLSILKSGRARAIRFTTLVALCRVLDCGPGDLLEIDPLAVNELEAPDGPSD